MIKKKIQFLLVSDQPTPNISAALDGRLKPDEVVLIVTPEQKKSGRVEWLKEILGHKGMKIKTCELDDAYDFAAIEKKIKASMGSYSNSEYALTLNVTGGTKPMALAAYQVFYYDDHEIFYVHDDSISWLQKKENNTQKNFKLEDKIKLKEFILSYGGDLAKEEQSGVRKEVRELGETWLKRATQQSKQISKLNYYAQQSFIKQSLSIDLGENDFKCDKLSVLIQDLIDIEMITLSGKTITFKDKESRTFVNGGWLEDIVFGIVLNLKNEIPSLQDQAKNSVINWKEAANKSNTKNELDVCLLNHNRLYIIECKTKTFKIDSSGVSEALNKLNTLTLQFGGSSGKGMLISYQKIKDIDKQRANLMGVSLSDLSDLNSLKGHIKEFIQSPQR